MQPAGIPGLAGLSSRERELMQALVASEKPVIRVDDVLSVLPGSRKAANLTISRLNKKGWLRRLRRGLYAIVPLESSTPRPPVEDAWPMAMELFAPCYISGWSAAEHWDLTEQIFNGVSVVSSHPQRSAEQTVAGVEFRVRTISPERVFGTKKLWFGSRRVDVADPHRLLIDILDSPAFGGGARHSIDVALAYWKSAHCDPETLLEYAIRYKRGTVFKRLGFIAELAGLASPDWLGRCGAHMSAGVSRLDPSGPNKGRILSRWRLRVNVPVPSQA